MIPSKSHQKNHCTTKILLPYILNQKKILVENHSAKKLSPKMVNLIMELSTEGYSANIMFPHNFFPMIW